MKISLQLKKIYKFIKYKLLILSTSVISVVPKDFRYEFSRFFLSRRIDLDVNTSKNTVYFFSIKPHTREKIFSSYAKGFGYKTVLICLGGISESDKSLYDECHIVRNKLVFQLCSWYLRGKIQHFFGLNGSKIYAFVRLRMSPIIVDIYDTCEGIVKSDLQEKKMEAYVIENAESITHRDLRIKYIYKNVDRVSKKDIFIPDIPKDGIKKNPNLKFKSDELHIISSGWIDGPANNILRTAEVLCSNKIHLHVLYNPFQDKDSIWAKKYTELSERCEYFHIEKPLYGNEYFEEISKYDFGISVFDQWFYADKQWEYSEAYLENCGSSRINDYIAAGLGVIITPILKFQIHMVGLGTTNLVLANSDFYNNPREILLKSKKNCKMKVEANAYAELAKEQSKTVKCLYQNVLRQ